MSLPAADLISLEGMDSYEAATHCASVMAAQRQAGAINPADSLLLNPANRMWVQGGGH